MLVPYVRVTSQINCGDVTILSQKRPSLAAMAKSAIDDWFYIGIVCSGHIKQSMRNKIIYSLPWITIFGWLLMRFANDLHSWLRHSWQSLANRLTRDPKIVIQGNSCINLYLFTQWVRVIEQGKSEGLDSCDRPSNLTQTGFKSSIFQPVWPWYSMDGPKKQ